MSRAGAGERRGGLFAAGPGEESKCGGGGAASIFGRASGADRGGSSDVSAQRSARGATIVWKRDQAQFAREGPR